MLAASLCAPLDGGSSLPSCSLPSTSRSSYPVNLRSFPYDHFHVVANLELTVGDLSSIVKGASQKKKEREAREYGNGAV